MNTKICKICKEEKNILENGKYNFLPSSFGKLGCENICKICKQEKVRNKAKKGKGEKELFLRIWAKRPHKSELSGEPLPLFDAWCFSHILPKGAYPELRLEEENIVLLTRQEHYEWHNVPESDLIKKDERWAAIFKKRDELKRKK